jgi:tRNA-dihydrouridine synthase
VKNREVPPLDYALVHQLKAAYPELAIVLNGGIATVDQAQVELGALDGVMMGRAAYQEPWRLLDVDPLIFGCAGAICATARRCVGADSLYRARIGKRRAAARHHPPRARAFPHGSWRACFPAASGDRGSQARCRSSRHG